MLRLDVGVGAEDDDEVGHERDLGCRPPRASSAVDVVRRGRPLVDLQQDHRHVVVLRRVADERRDLAQHALAQLVGRQVRVLLDQLAEPRLAEAVVARRSSPR